MKKVINYTIVSDPGIDDILALLLLKKLSSGSRNTLISTFGNVPESFTANNAKEFIKNFAPNWRFMRGAKIPLKPLKHPWPTYFHGPDGLWNTHSKNQKAAVKLIPAKNAYPQNNHVISLAPMTDTFKLNQNVNIEHLTVMGGTFNHPGNETRYAETNIAFDPDAAQKVFQNLSDSKIRLIPLDVTKKVYWDYEKIQLIPEKRSSYQWIKSILTAWFKNYGLKRQMPFDLHDPLAIYSIFYPHDFIWKNNDVSVMMNGEKRGQTYWKNSFENKVMTAIEFKLSPEKIAQKIFEQLFG